MESAFNATTKPMFYLSLQAAGAAGAAGLHLEDVLLEAGGGRPGGRLVPGLVFRSGGGLLQREAGQGRVAAAAHVERHVCRGEQGSEQRSPSQETVGGRANLRKISKTFG